MSSIGRRIKDALTTAPKKYQIQAVRFLCETGGRGILGDDMGLGKTYEAMAWAAIHPNARPIIVVCPSNVKYQWQAQFSEHANMKSVVMEGTKPYPPNTNVVIINYTILGSAKWPGGKRRKGARPSFPWVKLLRKLKPKLIILDEFHYIKNATALRTRATQALSKKVPHIISCSGTPIEKCPIEFFPVLQLTAPDKFPNFWDYAFKYCNPKPAYRGRGWDFSGANNLDELHEEVSTLMIRRMKTDVAKELPPKIRTALPMNIDNRQEYRKAEIDFLDWFTEKHGEDAALQAAGALGLVRLGQLKQIAAIGKLAAIRSWIEDFLEQTNEKVIVFCIHRNILQELQRVFPTAARVCGSVPSRKRPEQIKKFQKDPRCRVFLGQLKSAGVGLDGLHHASSTVLFAELGWNFSEMEQAEDRALRIGQTASTVNVYYTIARNTVEEKVLVMIQGKRNICHKILTGKDPMTRLFQKKAHQ